MGVAFSGAAEHATRHVTDERHVVGNQLHGSSIDELNELFVHYERIYGVDKQGVVHVISAICTAPVRSGRARTPSARCP